MTETLLRMIEVGSVSTLFYKSASLMTYLTILLCKFDKRRWSSENYKVSLETRCRGAQL